jgi:UDP-N-acetylmuramate dehydrogenase
LPNAGSFFKNPVITGEQAEALRARFPAMPQYPQVDGRAKLAAGWLIEQCGWKGHRAQTTQGSVGVHQDQALVLVHHGGAVGADLLSLAQAIQTSVEHTFGVALEREVNVW